MSEGDFVNEIPICTGTHIYVSIPPYQSVSKLLQRLKGKTSRKIQQEYPELRKRYWRGHLWAVGYFV